MNEFPKNLQIQLPIKIITIMCIQLSLTYSYNLSTNLTLFCIILVLTRLLYWKYKIIPLFLVKLEMCYCTPNKLTGVLIP